MSTEGHVSYGACRVLFEPFLGSKFDVERQA